LRSSGQAGDANGELWEEGGNRATKIPLGRYEKGWVKNRRNDGAKTIITSQRFQKRITTGGKSQSARGVQGSGATCKIRGGECKPIPFTSLSGRARLSRLRRASCRPALVEKQGEKIKLK